MIKRHAAHQGLHGHKHIERQRLVALLMIGSGLLRVVLWVLLIVAYLAGVEFIRGLYGSVSFVAVLSVVALLLTDWGQVASSLAQLTAGDAHHDAERARVETSTDFHQLDGDIARLAALQPGPGAEVLAAEIRQRLGGPFTQD